jgi:NAD(P)-dependent dehydrogenase (short-subunit alcohol dehydrogenase family)
MSSREPTAAEAERQLAAAADRHAEVVASIHVGGRSPSGQQTATRALARGVQLVWFTLSRAAAAGVPFERLVELTGWDEELVREVLGRGPEPLVVARLTPEGLDPDAVAQAAASFEATARLDALLASILADVGDPAWSPAAVELEDLCERVESAWRSWRQGLGRRGD